MDQDKKISPSEIMDIIDQLYAEETREKALSDLSTANCDEEKRSAYIWNSFGIVTILQREVMNGYKYICATKLDENVEKRICNSLTILRSIVTTEARADHIVNSYMMHFLCPYIESNNPALNNVRKVSLAVILEVTIHIQNVNTLRNLIDSAVVNICIDCVDHLENNENLIVLYMIYNILKNEFGNQYFKRAQYRKEILLKFMNTVKKLDTTGTSGFSDMVRKVTDLITLNRTAAYTNGNMP